MDQLPQLILTGGAAGALFYVLKLVVDGKLHSSSEVEGLKDDKRLLFQANESLRIALGETNTLLKEIVQQRRENNAIQKGPDR